MGADKAAKTDIALQDRVHVPFLMSALLLGVFGGFTLAVSLPIEMAMGARRVLACDVALALTGVAGPAEQDGMPAGTLCVGLVWPGGELTRTLRMPGLREQMRQFSVISSLDLLRRTITAASP